MIGTEAGQNGHNPVKDLRRAANRNFTDFHVTKRISRIRGSKMQAPSHFRGT